MIPVSTAHLQVAAVTHPGRRGKNNEDRLLASAFRISEKDPTPAILAVVADGVGGHRGGEVAADLAVKQITQVVAASDASQPQATLQDAFEQANQVIYNHSLANQDLSGMGTTCVCAWVIKDRLFAASVGDSRLYLVRGGVATRLSIDHTWVQEALDSGLLTPDQARSHPNAHVIRRHLGSAQPVVPDFRLRLSPSETDARALANQGLQLLPGDITLLCSDGLTDLVNDGEIGATLTRIGLQEALQELVDRANERGGHDNISIVAIQVPRQAMLTVPREKKVRRWLLAGMLCLLALALALYSAYQYWFSESPSSTSTILPSKAPLVVPTLIPTQIPLQATLTPVTAETVPTSITSWTPLPETQFPSQATYTPWPTSTELAPSARLFP
jgi:protein phosphatase